MPKAISPLSLKALACVKGERALFKSLSCEIEPGTLVRIAGANGTGKTSLLRLVAGLSQPAAGNIFWMGQERSADLSAYLAQVLFVGHASAIKDELTPVENILASCSIQGEVVTPIAVQEVLTQLGLGERLTLESSLLSAGQRRRIALARLWLTQRGLWLLDEPFNALDTRAVQLLANRISSHVQEGGICLYTTHQSIPIHAPVSIELSLDPVQLATEH